MKKVGNTYNFNWFEMRRIFKSNIVGYGSQAIVFAKEDYAYKIFHKCIPEKYSLYSELARYSNTNFDRELDMIEYLGRIKDKRILESLPIGIIFNNYIFTGILYNYHEGFNNGKQLLNEDTSLLLENIKKVLELNIILSENGICNEDLKLGNIMYKGKEVRLVDLDSASTDNDYSNSLFFFFIELRKGLENRLNNKEKIEELRKILVFNKDILNSDHYEPIRQIERLEKEKLL